MPRSALALLLSLGGAWLGSCGLLRSAGETTAGLAGAVIPGSTKQKPTTPEEQLADVLRYADQSLSQFEESTRRFEVAAGKPEALLEAARWRVSAYRIVLQLATGPSTLTGLLDLVFTVTAAGWLIDDQVEDTWGESVQPIRTVLDRAKESGWTLLARHLPEDQVKEARALIGQWRAENPRVTFEVVGDFPGFVSLAQKRPGGESAGLLGMLGLDPLGGLEPAVRELMQLRLLGQRALFFAQNLPRVVTGETELALLELRKAPESLEMLDSVQRTSESLASFATTAAALPEALRVEREAAVAQLSSELSVQRAGLVADLTNAREPLTEILTESRASLAAGQEMAKALTETVQALESWLGSFAKDEEPAEGGAPATAASTTAAEPEPKGKPFDITDYGASAERIGIAARELNALVAQLDQSLPEAQRLLDATVARGEQSVDLVALRALQVGLTLIAAASIAVLLVRRRKAPAAAMNQQS